MTDQKSRVLTIPNLITLVRIFLIPVFAVALFYQYYDYALVLFVAAALTDFFDGLVARLIKQKTRLGAFLDAFADKALLITSFIILSLYGWISEWLVICVIGRDLVITLGWLLLILTSNSPRVGTILSGKVAIASQLILISYVMLAVNLPELPDHAPEIAEWIVAALTVLSGIQYLYRGLIQRDGR
jgi:cardiolipin synthase (CMP-forming)